MNKFSLNGQFFLRLGIALSLLFFASITSYGQAADKEDVDCGDTIEKEVEFAGRLVCIPKKGANFEEAKKQYIEEYLIPRTKGLFQCKKQKECLDTDICILSASAPKLSEIETPTRNDKNAQEGQACYDFPKATYKMTVKCSQCTSPRKEVPVGEKSAHDHDGHTTNNTVEAGAVLLYPNPAGDIITLELALENQAKDLQIIVYDMMGQMVLNHRAGQQDAGAYIEELNISNLASGMYLTTVLVDNQAIANSKFTVHQP